MIIMALVRFIHYIALGLLLTALAVRAAPKESLVSYLPGFNGILPSEHYAGYVTIEGNHPGKKNLFYYFIVSERNPRMDPVVLWLNGGPGCSSFDGFVYEHGPFNFEEGKSKGNLPVLYLNPFSWSKVANMIYLDSPCGVGLSYSDNPKNYVTGDRQTASDTHAFLLKWFELYPEFLSNPFYISGESYAGVYVPTLASEVVKGIKNGAKPTLNFKGYLIGNGVADNKYDSNGYVPFIYGMGLISSDMYEACQTTCRGNFYEHLNQRCVKSLNNALRALAGLNSYNILEPCYHSPNGIGKTSLAFSFQGLVENGKPLSPREKMLRSRSPLWSFASNDNASPSPEPNQPVHIPCVNDELATTWLNEEAVRKAIHAAPASMAGPWAICATRVQYYGDTGSMIPYHRSLTSQGYKALIYSGDHDSVVPYTGTEAWTRNLGHKIVEEWRSWMSSDQVAGYLQSYEHNLTFLTIKGAGHTVPQYKPRESLDFFSRWLDGKAI